jgi:hypothetical protein
VCGFGVLLLFGCLFVVLKPCVERSYEGKSEAGRMFEGEVFIHGWMDGRVGLDLFLTQLGRERWIGLDIASGMAFKGFNELVLCRIGYEIVIPCTSIHTSITPSSMDFLNLSL